MQWTEQLKAVETAAVALDARAQSPQTGIETDAPLIAQIMAHLDAADPIVAFAAKQQLERMLTREHAQLSMWIELLLAQQVGLPVSNGYRFQLLRSALVTRPPPPPSAESNRETSDADESSSEESGSATELHPALEAILKRIQPLSAMAARTCEENSPVAVLELLAFLRELVKQIHAIAVAKQDDGDETLIASQWLDALYGPVRLLVAAFRGFECEKQPTYVSCAIADFLHECLHFVTSAVVNSNTSNSSDHTRRLPSKQWLQTCVDAVALRSPLSSFAMKLLCAPEASEISARASLISSESRFPFLQSWLSFASSLVLMYLENGDSDAWESLLQPAPSPVIETNNGVEIPELPDRDTLLAVLSEQDDVMVDVLDTLLRITVFLEAPAHASKVGKYQSHWLVKYHREQLDPNLLFGSILRTFGHDHLVVLDLLTSSETSMLEYLLRYLRRLAANWDSSCRVLERESEQRLLSPIMSVLIRLRLEIEKQVAAAIFPYNPTPLLRRLRAVEQLYDGT